MGKCLTIYDVTGIQEFIFASNKAKENIGGSIYVQNIFKEGLVNCIESLKGDVKTGWRESLNDFLRWSNEDMTESLKKCQVPIIAINSDMEPTNIEAFRKLVPSFQARIVPDVGHVIMWDAPDQFNDLLEDSIQEFIK